MIKADSFSVKFVVDTVPKMMSFTDHFVLGSLCSEDESRIIITAPHTTAMEYFTQREGLYGMVAGANVSNWIFPGKECHNTLTIVSEIELPSSLLFSRASDEESWNICG